MDSKRKERLKGMPQKEMPQKFSAFKRQTEIYIAGLSGRRPKIPIDWDELQRRAEKKMTNTAFSFFVGGAGHGSTIRRNRQAFEKWRIVPRMLRNVSNRDCGTTLLGEKLPSPFLLAPIGVLELASPQGDLQVARAAEQEQIPYIFSNQASVAMELSARAMPNTAKWFQLYWSKSNELVASFVRRAENCGCSAIVITLDTTMLGWRTRDLDLGHLPFMKGQGLAQYTSDPVFQRMIDEPLGAEAPPAPPLSLALIANLWHLFRKHPGSLWSNLRGGRALKSVRQFITTYFRPSLTWSDLAFVRERTKLPILLKGILHPEDARLAIEYGMDGLIVSNHGGRQVDGALSSLEALPSITEAVKGQIPILLDSGIRGGADIFKALALGAKAVCIGRPYAYALAIRGEEGVRELIRNYKADFDLTMGLAGCREVSEINRNCLAL